MRFHTTSGVQDRRIERVMLLYPPVTFAPQSMKQCNLPLGLAYIGAVIRDRVELEVLDAAAEGWDHEEKAGDKLLRYGLSFDEIEERIRRFRPDLIGMSCIFSSQFRNVEELTKIAKRINPGIITVTGGTHPSFMPEQCMERAPDLDLIAVGEGELTLLDLINASQEDGDPGDVKGLVWRRNGEVFRNTDREPIQDLDALPFPARDLFKTELYSRIGIPMGTVFRRRPYMNMITSRGCPYHCTFCSSTRFWGNAYRRRSPENVLQEMEQLVEDFGVRELKFFDDNLTSDRPRAEAIFQGMIDKNLGLSWNMPNGVHVVTLDEKLLTLMKKSGCYELTLAVESGDEDVLRNIIKKPTKLDRVKDVSRLTREIGISTNSFFIIGFPGETREQIEKTLDFSMKLDLDRMSFFIFQPLPGTRLFDLTVEKGYLDPAAMTENLDYFEGHFNTPEWTRDELHHLRRKWVWKYNASLLFRHPIRFLKNYLVMFARPKQTWEILKRLVRT